MEPIRVAQIMGKMLYGGTESVVMNYYRHIDRDKIQFDFIADSDSIMPIPRIEEIESLGGRVFIVPPYQKLNKYIPALVNLFKEQQYQIVHAHLNTLNVFPLYAAKKAGVPVRISHSHSTAAKGEVKKNLFKYMLRPFAGVYPTHYAACSFYAGEWLFGKKRKEQGKVTVFTNAIELEKYKYDEVVRAEVRKELGLENKFVVGHVGRFCFQKNQDFLIDIFEKVYERNSDAVLIMVGDGEDLERIKERVKHLGEGVKILGTRTDVCRIYQAMDVFVFPSRYEGLGIAAVEAQVSGLRVIASSKIPQEAKISDGMTFLQISDDAEKWATEILLTKNREILQLNPQNDYNIVKQSIRLQDYYKRCCKK